MRLTTRRLPINPAEGGGPRLADATSSTLGRALLWLIVALSVGAQVRGLFLALIEPDEALYAVISRELSQSGQWASLTLNGAAWLDKPHLPFWCAAASMRLLGPTGAAYRLPGLLFFSLGVAYVYWAGRRFYAPPTGGWAAIITLTAYHLVLSNHDVRAEAYLVGLVTAALFHLAAALETRRIGHAFAAGLFVGLSVITKGPFLFISTGGAAAVACLLGRRGPTWGQVAAFCLTLLLPLTSEMVALAIQHGAGSPSLSVQAIRALFIDGQLNRFLQEAPSHPQAGALYFVHTLVWAFAPWFPGLATVVVAGLWGLGAGWRGWVAGTSVARLTFYASAALTFIALSSTRFQLPYYLNFEMPTFGLVVGGLIALPPEESARRVAAVLQLVLAGVALAFLAAVLLLVEVPGRWLGVAVLALPAALLPLHGLTREERPWVFSAAAGSAAALVMNLVFYPWLLQFEAGRQAALALPTHQRSQVYSVEYRSYAFDFYALPEVHWLVLDQAPTWRLPPGTLVYARPSDVPVLEEAGLAFEVAERFLGIAVSQPRRLFLYPSTRSAALEETLLLRTR